MRILVTGASGYIGGRLVPRLLFHRHDVVVLTRDAVRLQGRYPGAELVEGDLLRPETLPQAFVGVDVAYYLAHSMREGERDFAQRDREAARAFATAAAAAGVRRIVYLGGLGEDASGLSRHLASRHAVGEELARHGVPVLEFRAAIVIGSGSASFEILRALTERLPIMITPRWVRTRCQPIGISDVIAYLVAALDHPDARGVVEIGGRDVLTYGEMMLGYARIRGMRRVMIPVPVLTPWLSSHWVGLVTPVPSAIARPLVEGLRNEVIVRDPVPAERFGITAMSYEEATRRATDRTSADALESSWFDSYASGTTGTRTLGRSLVEEREGMIIERRASRIAATPARVFEVVESLGGPRGWLYGNALWRLRGSLDLMLGGVGMRRGRRDPASLRPGDALDFWRVEEIDRPRRLRLRSEMRLPGEGWLQYEVEPHERGATLRQTAFYAPRGILGLAYWYVLYPIHGLLFRGLTRRIAELATAPGATPERAAPVEGRAAG